MEQMNHKSLTCNSVLGLVLAGGKSTRMGADKSALFYDGRPQILRAIKLLHPFCKNVFLSIRQDQQHQLWHQKYAKIFDRTDEMGPLSGLLSAHLTRPSASWLVLPCDMPFVSKSLLARLISKRNPRYPATIVYNEQHQLYEPLVALYEPQFLSVIFREFSKGHISLQQILANTTCTKVVPKDTKTIQSIDTPTEYQQAYNHLEITS